MLLEGDLKERGLPVFLCAFAAELHVWESLLRSGAMEHHIVVARGGVDDCFVCCSSCSGATALSGVALH